MEETEDDLIDVVIYSFWDKAEYVICIEKTEFDVKWCIDNLMRKKKKEFNDLSPEAKDQFRSTFGSIELSKMSTEEYGSITASEDFLA